MRLFYFHLPCCAFILFSLTLLCLYFIFTYPAMRLFYFHLPCSDTPYYFSLTLLCPYFSAHLTLRCLYSAATRKTFSAPCALLTARIASPPAAAPTWCTCDHG